MNIEELSRAAAKIMGKTYFSYYCEYTRGDKSGIEVQICPTKEIFEWNPLSDAGAYQLDLIEAELRHKHRCRIVTDSELHDFSMLIYDFDGKIISKGQRDDDITKIRETRLRCYVNAYEKLKEMK